MKFTIYKGRTKPRGKPYRWRLQGDNNETIAQGQAYKNHADCLGAINLVRDANIVSTPINDKTIKIPKAA